MKATKDSTTEQSILEAAEKMFLEKGFALTSTVGIARVAGCNQALVHYYFRSKEKLFEKVFEKKVRLFLSTFLQISGQDLTFEEKLRLKIETHFEMLQANPRLPFLFFNELTTNPRQLEIFTEEMSDVPVSIFKQLQKELDEEIVKGTVRPMTALNLLFTILALNVVLFLAAPIFKTITGMPDSVFEKLIEQRKQENVRTILQSLRP